MSSLNSEPTSFDRHPNDDFSEFVDFEVEDGVFSETLADLSENALDPLLPDGSDDVPNTPIIQPPVAYRDCLHEWQDNLEPPTVTPAQLNLQFSDQNDFTQLDLRIGSQQPRIYQDPQRQHRDDDPRLQQRLLPALAPQNQVMGTDSRHHANIKTPDKPNAAKRRRRKYSEEDISCLRCNIKMETPGELRKHHKRYHDDPQEKCSICSHRTKFKRDLKRHYQVHHPKSAEKMGIPVLTSICPINSCRKKYARPDHLTRHLKRAHATSLDV